MYPENNWEGTATTGIVDVQARVLDINILNFFISERSKIEIRMLAFRN
jgi:hypothetical protein